jgi:hypothetical protein
VVLCAWCEGSSQASGWNRNQNQFQPDSTRKRSHNLHETYQLPCVEYINPDDGNRRCPKHVEFYDKIKFWIFDPSSWLLYT